jgi:hypothetical protein
VEVCNLRKVIGKLEQLEQSVMICSQSVLHPILWINQLFSKASHWYVVYLMMTSDMFRSGVKAQLRVEFVTHLRDGEYEEFIIIIVIIYLNCKCVFIRWHWYYNKTQHTNNTHHTE